MDAEITLSRAGDLHWPIVLPHQILLLEPQAIERYTLSTVQRDPASKRLLVGPLVTVADTLPCGGA